MGRNGNYKQSLIPLLVLAALAVAVAARGAEPVDYLNGRNVGITIGTIHGKVVADLAPSAKPVYFQTKSDIYEALVRGKVDAGVDNIFSATKFQSKLKGLRVLEPFITHSQVGSIVSKDQPELRRALDEFIGGLIADGTLDDMLNRWMHMADTPPMPDIAEGTGKALNFGTAGNNDGFSYFRDGALTGFDLELARRFALSQNRRLVPVVMDFGGLIPAVQSGKLDFASNLFEINAERKKNVDFSIPYLKAGTVVIVRSEETASESVPFWQGLKTSFRQNLLQEDRWKMLARGLGVTLIISFASLVLGTVLGFLVCLLNISRNPFANLLGKIYVTLLRGTPIVVLLLIIYYIVFAKVNIDSILVAIIAYGLNAGAYIGEILRSAILTVDKGQIEAARSMGFSRAGAFFTVTLPQAARVALPVYQSEFVSLVKSTAVVGYIAVMDLTKASDIIRSRTYDAFFPILAVAAIYLLVTAFFVWIFNRVNIMTSKRLRRRES